MSNPHVVLDILAGVVGIGLFAIGLVGEAAKPAGENSGGGGSFPRSYHEFKGRARTSSFRWYMAGSLVLIVHLAYRLAS